MRITQETDYAFRIIIYLAKLGKGVKADAKTISQSEGVSLRFTLKILRKLSQSKLLISFRGVNGGYALNVDANSLNMKEIIESIEGPIHLNKCLGPEKTCNISRSASCKLHNIFCDIQNKLIKEFENVKISDIIKE